ncbi:MAG: energy transducer TonB [Bacteroidales bacterium]|nr:energy transducer TonB [Bacteroidales bacterium]
MKRHLPLLAAILLSICTCSIAYPQRQYYIGVPNHVDYVRDSARIVLDLLPWNANGRLLEQEMPRWLEPLNKFLDEHPGHKCNFLLYSNESNEEHNLRYTTYQGERLSEYFTYVDTLFGQKYLNNIIPHRLPNPLFRALQPDSSEKIHKAEPFYLKECVIVELIQQKPISKSVQISVFHSAPADSRVFDVAPVFPRGTEGLYNFLVQRMDYFVVGQSNVVGVVLVEFDIEPDGSVANAELKRSLFPALDEQALRIVKEMPRWQPAFKDGRPVRCHYLIPFYYGMM